MLSVFKRISYLFSKFSETCTCERVVVLFLVRYFQEVLELHIQIVVFIDDRMLRHWLVDSISAKLVVENVEIVKVVRLAFLL